MKINLISLGLLLSFLAGCQNSGIKPTTFPDQSGNKKEKGLFSKNPEGFVITSGDIFEQENQPHSLLKILLLTLDSF